MQTRAAEGEEWPEVAIVVKVGTEDKLGQLKIAHQTSPIVKLGDLFHFTNSHPYEAILGAIDASWGVLLRLNFRRRLKKMGKKMNFLDFVISTLYARQRSEMGF